MASTTPDAKKSGIEEKAAKRIASGSDLLKKPKAIPWNPRLPITLNARQIVSNIFEKKGFMFGNK